MSDWKIGLSTGCLYQLSIFDCLEAISNAGFTAIEISSSLSHLNYHDGDSVKRAKAMMADLGIEAYSFHAPFGESIDISAPDGKKRRVSCQELLSAAKAAADLGVKYLLVHTGPDKAVTVSTGERMRRLENASKVLNKVAAFCQSRNMDLVLENVLSHLLFGNIRDMLWLLGSITYDNVGTCFDTGHAFLSSEMDLWLNKLSGSLKYIHAHDNKGQYDDHLSPGKGNVNWESLFNALNRMEFQGRLILELAGQHQKNKEIILEDALQGRLYLINASKQ